MADYEGLSIKPLLPNEWDKVTIKRHFRNNTYNITIIDVHSGDDYEIIVDGNLIEGHIVPVYEEGSIHDVIVRKK